MVINHLDKLFVTNDAATIVNELEIQHPAAKLLVLAGKAQQEEIGDGANLTVSFAGEVLQNAEELIRMGLHPSEIIIGYNKAINEVCVVYNIRPIISFLIVLIVLFELIFLLNLLLQTVRILDELVEGGSENMDVRNKEEVVSRMKAAVASKQFGLENILCPLIAEVNIMECLFSLVQHVVLIFCCISFFFFNIIFVLMNFSVGMYTSVS